VWWLLFCTAINESSLGNLFTLHINDALAAKESAVKVEPAGDTASGPKDSPTEPPTKKKRVKAVTWVDEAKLCSFFYFQLDENERGKFLRDVELHFSGGIHVIY
jgi:hypothetical protein